MKEEVTQELGGFDPLVVHTRDPETKRITKVNPFRMIAHKGVRFYEWPKGSGNLWFENRVAAGRLGDDGVPVRNKPHEEWIAPITADEKIGRDNMVLEQENKKLMAELSAIKKEQEMDKKLASTPATGEVKKAPVANIKK